MTAKDCVKCILEKGEKRVYITGYTVCNNLGGTVQQFLRMATWKTKIRVKFEISV